MPSIYEKYNLKQVINTSGRMTALGVSTPRPEVVQAAMDGMNHYFEMKDLVNKTGEYIAKLLDVEGATVVSCASAGIAQSVAAVLVKDSDWLLENLHVTPIENNEIVLPKGHNVNFWRAGRHHVGAGRRQAGGGWLRERMLCRSAGGGDHPAHCSDPLHQITPLRAKKACSASSRRRLSPVSTICR
ncbi:pyridoxal phosphate-dependent enzyme [Enterobacter cancerogenus]|uniref:Pyridoxal phosphate-dependent enzyme n=1 Tax=Enterobacter cancerogenus TaxID=69218 RepID=A0A484XVF2_9ENTR|nr:pyridoxal phosphate-dependent enzyme [Enterobacter cancerogenus]